MDTNRRCRSGAGVSEDVQAFTMVGGRCVGVVGSVSTKRGVRLGV